MSNQEEGGAPAASSTATGDQGATAQPLTTEQQAELEALEQKRQEERAAYQRQRDQLRADTPPGRVKVRVERGATPLGLVVFDRWNGRVLRTSRMENWRTEELQLHAGESAYVVPLVGDDLTEFEHAAAQVRKRTELAQPTPDANQGEA